MNQPTYKDDIEAYWGGLWQGQLNGLDPSEITTRFKFTYFLKPVLDTLPIGAKLCELGSGNCQWLLLCRVYRPDLQLFGVDLTDTAVALGEKLGVRVTQADIRAIPLPDNTFDAVFSWGVIEHVEETSIAFTEQYRIARSWVVADVPNRCSLPAQSIGSRRIKREMTSYEFMVKEGKQFSPEEFSLMVKSVVSTKDRYRFMANYFVFPYAKGMRRFVEPLVPDWLRKRYGQNIGVLVEKNTQTSS